MRLIWSDIENAASGVPKEVDRVLRQKAARLKQSLNQVVLHELTTAAIGRPLREDFSDLTGHWIPDPGFDEVLASQRRINSDKWK